MTRHQMIGRHALAHVPEPRAGYPAMPTSVHNRAGSITAVVVEDAYDPRRRHRAMARIDLLDRERRARRIDEASFLIGREIESAFEQMHRISGGGQWFEGDRIDAAAQAELALMMGVERAFIVNKFLNWLVRHVGKTDTRLIWLLLAERQTFLQASQLFGRSGVRGLRYTMDRFRDALSSLADARAARGRDVALRL